MGNKLSRNIFIGLFAGIVIGLLLGEYAQMLGVIGDVFIGLMQMTVLPYITVSLLANLGKINLASQRNLLIGGAIILVSFLFTGLLVLFVLPYFFPTFQSSTFFSSSLITEREPIDFIGIYVPANIFSSLSDSIVPAVVIFCIIVGAALNTVPNNGPFIRALDVLADALNKANKYIIKLTPYGIFGIAANTVASLSLSEFGLMQVYIVIYFVAALLLTFVFLPMVVAAITPFTFREIIDIPKNSLITIFATGKIIILLPQLIENVQALFDKHQLNDEQTKSGSELLMPLAYPFPNLGTLVIMIFIPFAAWFSGTNLSLGDQGVFLGSVLMSSFVAPITGVPFILETLEISADTFQLFIVSTAITDRVRVVLGAMHLFTLTILSIAYVKGILSFSFIKLVKPFAFMGIAMVMILLPAKWLIGDSFQEAFDKYEAFAKMEVSHQRVPEKVIKYEDSEPYFARSFQEIKARGVLRIGFSKDMLPYVFRNQSGQLVGYDVELFHIFGKEIGIDLQWVEIPREGYVKALNEGVIDVYAGGTPIMADIMDKVQYSKPYSETNLALIVKDHQRSKFKSLERIKSDTSLIFATNQSDYLIRRVREEAPNLRFKKISSARSFLKGKVNVDAMLFSAEAGSAWTLVYPEYSIVKPKGLEIRLPVSFILAKESIELKDYMDKWVELKEFDGTLENLFDSWIKGGASITKEQKWSVVEEVMEMKKGVY